MVFDPGMAPAMMLFYWRNEQSGQLSAVVHKFVMTNESLTEAERDTFAYYLRIWADFPGWQESQRLTQLRQSFDERVANGDRTTISQWLSDARIVGIDPL